MALRTTNIDLKHERKNEKMKHLKTPQDLNEDTENLSISDVSCRCSSISEISKKRIKELMGLKKYARDQFTVGLIDSQIKYWSELQ
jgi:hypothetical protein